MYNIRTIINCNKIRLKKKKKDKFSIILILQLPADNLIKI